MSRPAPLLAALALAAVAADVTSQQPAEAPAQEPGLLVEDLAPGFGDEALPGMLVVVHYTGWLHDPAAPGFRGRQFDSSRDRQRPFTFPLGAGRVISGWDQGVAGMRVGGLRRLTIPPALAYGDRNIGNGLIPPGSTLLFEVELLGVESVTTTTQNE